MAQRTQLDDSNNQMHEAYACLLQNGLDGAAEALRILVNEASRIERAQHLQAMPYERSAQRQDYANGYKPKTVLTRVGEVTFEVPQVRSGGFYPSALERGSRSEQAMNLALAEMYVVLSRYRCGWKRRRWQPDSAASRDHAALQRGNLLYRARRLRAELHP